MFAKCAVKRYFYFSRLKQPKQIKIIMSIWAVVAGTSSLLGIIGIIIYAMYKSHANRIFTEIPVEAIKALNPNLTEGMLKLLPKDKRNQIVNEYFKLPKTIIENIIYPIQSNKIKYSMWFLVLMFLLAFVSLILWYGTKRPISSIVNSPSETTSLNIFPFLFIGSGSVQSWLLINHVPDSLHAVKNIEFYLSGGGSITGLRLFIEDLCKKQSDSKIEVIAMTTPQFVFEKIKNDFPPESTALNQLGDNKILEILISENDKLKIVMGFPNNFKIDKFKYHLLFKAGLIEVNEIKEMITFYIKNDFPVYIPGKNSGTREKLDEVFKMGAKQKYEWPNKIQERSIMYEPINTDKPWISLGNTFTDRNLPVDDKKIKTHFISENRLQIAMPYYLYFKLDHEEKNEDQYYHLKHSKCFLIYKILTILQNNCDRNSNEYSKIDGQIKSFAFSKPSYIDSCDCKVHDSKEEKIIRTIEK
jgi:hypothetical protein